MSTSKDQTKPNAVLTETEQIERLLKPFKFSDEYLEGAVIMVRDRMNQNGMSIDGAVKSVVEFCRKSKLIN